MTSQAHPCHGLVVSRLCSALYISSVCLEPVCCQGHIYDGCNITNYACAYTIYAREPDHRGCGVEWGHMYEMCNTLTHLFYIYIIVKYFRI